MSGPSSMRTPLGRVRNLGSSHSGTTDFWRQRLTAVAMALLIVPVVVIILMLIGRNQAGAAGADDHDVVGVILDRIGFTVSGRASAVGGLAVALSSRTLSSHGLNSR